MKKLLKILNIIEDAVIIIIGTGYIIFMMVIFLMMFHN